MRRKIKILACHSFRQFEVDHSRRSDMDVFAFFRKHIHEFSDGQIELLTLSEEPNIGLIPQKVQEQMEEADGVFFLLTGFMKDQFSPQWLPPPYVVSEGGYASALYAKTSPWKGIFGFVETDVQRERLGIAFSRDQNIPVFKRDNLDGCLKELQKYVCGMLQHYGRAQGSDQGICAEQLHKRVFVHRDGFVAVRSRYQFVVLEPSDFTPLKQHHSIWRCHCPLLSFEQMTEGDISGTTRKPYIQGRFISPTSPLTPGVWLEAVKVRTAHNGHELEFAIRFRQGEEDLKLHSPCRLEYELAWGYPGAFLSLQELRELDGPLPMNSVGLRTGTRGPIGEAMLDVFFERNWRDNEEESPFETPPSVRTSNCSTVPDMTPKEFYASNEFWRNERKIEPYSPLSDIAYECYRVRVNDLHGQFRVIWQPRDSYYLAVPRSRRTAKDANSS